MKILLTGAGGQLGRALKTRAPAGATLVALAHGECDIADRDATREVLARERPDVIVNAAAYTAVDRAEREPEAAQRANVEGPGILAAEARRLGARLLHVSTDFVFDGESSAPYRPDAQPHPLNVYGRTKLQGEERVRSELPDASVIVRTGWLYGASGANFMRSILNRLRDKGEARVVADQIGTPTSTTSLAAVLWRIVERGEIRGIHHWSDAGVASWYDFAVAIAEEAVATGLVQAGVSVTPISTAEYPSATVRPRFSVLDKASLIAATGLQPPHWRVALRNELRHFSYA